MLEELGVPHPSGGPGREPLRLDGRETHKKVRDPNAHIDVSSPWGGSTIGLPGGGGGGVNIKTGILLKSKSDKDRPTDCRAEI